MDPFNMGIVVGMEGTEAMYLQVLSRAPSDLRLRGLVSKYLRGDRGLYGRTP